MFEGLGDPDKNCSRAATVMINCLLKERGNVLLEKVRAPGPAGWGHGGGGTRGRGGGACEWGHGGGGACGWGHGGGGTNGCGAGLWVGSGAGLHTLGLLRRAPFSALAHCSVPLPCRPDEDKCFSSD